ncbi:hypothetical protein BBI08_05450 [Planococcus halocryophilus]|uniref:DUF1259 domain-containing protein n=1 Tax=Planococcus halocryophilus TaxID=1215089 RepID=A0A1C7DV60_9BACL|nr:hypothetical protein BBI08_05450 [Planococcus halocryophilus]
MEQVEKSIEIVAEQVAQLLQAEVALIGGKVLFDKKRTLKICTAGHSFVCTLDLDISFEYFHEDGSAVNRAEILLLPEEVQPFLTALNTSVYPFPTVYRQWIHSNPNLASVCLVATEPPERFAERLTMALQLVGC